MSTTSTTVLASGTASAVKLFVAALAFTSAYVGFSAYSNASSATEPTKPITLSARELPITETTTAPAKAGQVSVTLLADGTAGCVRSYVARTVLASPGAAQTVSYGWKLSRWSPATKTWRSYLTEYDGFSGAERAVEWRPQVAGNPGWYRVELTVRGAKPVKSDRFQVSC